MIDFSTLESLIIPEGVVSSIKDTSGKMLWRYIAPISLTVEKRTISTRAGEEACVLLDIYPKSANSVVRVTYEGYSKVLTFTDTNKKTVFFGTYLGETDPVSTPSSGTLTIGGECLGFGSGRYSEKTSSTFVSTTSPCITGVSRWGEVEMIPDYAFMECTQLALTSLPTTITRIGDYAFMNCTQVKITIIPKNVTYIGDAAFYIVANGTTAISSMLANLYLPANLLEIGAMAFPCYYYGGATNGYKDYPRVINEIEIDAPTPPKMEVVGGTIGVFWDTSANTRGRNIKVPKGCSAAYKSAPGWSLYADYITE